MITLLNENKMSVFPPFVVVARQKCKAKRKPLIAIRLKANVDLIESIEKSNINFPNFVYILIRKNCAFTLDQQYQASQAFKKLPSIHKRVCDLHVVRHGTVKSIQNRSIMSTLTNLTVEPYFFLCHLHCRGVHV